MSDETKEKIGDYRNLIVWQKSIGLVTEIYAIIRKFPTEERFGLVAQMRRAAVSAPSNIAEGQARHTTGEFVQFVSHAEGSLAELDTQLVIATKLKFLGSASAEALRERVFELRRMLNALRRKLISRKK